MGRLVQDTIETLYQGVSRQPSSVRLPGQVEEAVNSWFSVVTGGWEKRFPTEHVARLEEFPTGQPVFFHIIDRDAFEQYGVGIAEGEVYVWDLTDGSPQTVNYTDFTIQVAEIAADGTSDEVPIYFHSGETEVDLNASGFGSASVIVQGYNTGTSMWDDLHTFTADGDQTVTITGYDKLRTVTSSYVSGTIVIKATFESTEYLQGIPEEFTAVTVADFTFLVNKTIITEMDPTTPEEDDASFTFQGTVQTFNDLPASPSNNDVYKIANTASEDDDYFVKWVAADSVWIETTKIDEPYKFLAASMPHQLVSEADGTFTFARVDWAERRVGDDVVTPPPDFVGYSVEDLVLHRKRLVVVANETAYYGKAGDYTNFWPTSAFQVNDDDPFGVDAGTNRINKLKFAVPFRKALFLTSDAQQFEAGSSSSKLTPKTGVMDLATSYEASTLCRPLALGDELYFPASDLVSTVLQEYYYDDETFTNTAADVTKHVKGYVPPNPLEMAGDTTAGVLWVRTAGEPSKLYVYSVFWNGNEKVQSAWSVWDFGAGNDIHSIKWVRDHLVMVIGRPAEGGHFLERIFLSHYVPVGSNIHFGPLLDRRVLVQGTYDEPSNLTTWIVPYEHKERSVVVDETGDPLNQFGAEFPTPTTITVPGDHSSAPCFIGELFESEVELSTIFFRDAEGQSETSGRLQLKYVRFDYAATGYFQVQVTNGNRESRTYTMSGRILGSASNLIGTTPIVSQGTFKVPIRGDSRRANIKVINNTHVPHIITKMTWLGFYNELTRQE